MAHLPRAHYALLIGSANGLKGTENDVERIHSVLEETGLGFEFHHCHGTGVATRERILAEFASVITWAEDKSQANTEPVVVIYYSGHGGEVRASRDAGPDGRRYEYLVPTDYNRSADKFNGILDHEITYFLKKLTVYTKNVTFIMDCCHSGRMARNPRAKQLKARMTEELEHHKLAEHMEALVDAGTVEADVPIEGNPDVVRIVACYPKEVAWEGEDEDFKVGGVMTRLLVETLREAKDRGLSWRTVMSRIRELAAAEHYSQHPAVEGPGTRILFQQDHSDDTSHVVRMDGDQPVIEAGRVAGMREGSVYAIMPAGFEHVDDAHSLGEVQVVSVAAFYSNAKFIKQAEGKQIDDDEGALAFLKTEATYQWKAEYPEENAFLKDRFEESKFLRPCPVAKQTAEPAGTNSLVDCNARFAAAHQQLTAANEKIAATHRQLALAYAKFKTVNHQQAFKAYDTALATHTQMVNDYKRALDDYVQELGSHKIALGKLGQSLTASREKVLVEIKQVGNRLVVYNGDKVECFSEFFEDKTLRAVSARAYKRAEAIARSQHLFTIPSGLGKEKFEQELSIEFGLVKDGELHAFDMSGAVTVTEGSRVYLQLRNESLESVYVSGFSIDAAGDVVYLMAETDGAEIEPKGEYTLGYNEGESKVKGLFSSWADSVSRASPVVEAFVLFVTSDPVDLRHFQTTGASRGLGDAASELERLAYELSTGDGRGYKNQAQRPLIKYSIIRLPYTFLPSHQ